jgi:hypothetical protein
MSNDLDINIHNDINMNTEITPPRHPMLGPPVRGAGGGAWGGVGDININIDINMNIDIHTNINNMSINNYIDYYYMNNQVFLPMINLYKYQVQQN